ncbi:hypothetical protein [Pseudooceanicola sp. LIPI14-2-Ac024]|uniref:hypothetical protein n=1 Tax=Pseudooceanicola sp. LIPI14-2-Ac024 TaxID=3344875 RepID=UPI0035D01755
MTRQKSRISQITYNPATRCFEAAVTLMEGDEAYTYPVSLPAPLDSAYADVTRAVLAKAQQAHRATRPGIRSLKPTRDALAMPIVIPPSVREATVGLWDRLLNDGKAA